MHDDCDISRDITKNVRMEVPDFEGKVKATQFVDGWLQLKSTLISVMSYMIEG